MHCATRSNKKRKQEEPLQVFINNNIKKLAPEEAVRRIKEVFPKILKFNYDDPTDMPVILIEIDLSVGFWRMMVPHKQRSNFVYIILGVEGSLKLVVFSSHIQMGLSKSPAYIYHVIKVAFDITEGLFLGQNPLTPKGVEACIEPEETVTYAVRTIQLLQMYVDNFILVTQPCSARELRCFS